MNPAAHLRMLALNEVSTFLQMRIVRQIFTAHRGEGCNARALQELRNFPTVAL